MMQTLNIKVAKVKCQVCAANIKKGLADVGEVAVDVATGEVEIQGVNLDRQQITVKLAELGYPAIEA